MQRMFRAMFFLALTAGAPAMAGPKLMPLPAEMTQNPGQLRIDSSFRIVTTGTSDSRLDAAVQRFAARIFRQAGLSAIHIRNEKPALTVECAEPLPDVPALGTDESYRLDVTPAGARIAASTCTGALRVMETFAQLISAGAASAVHIDDRPRFPWRGLMLD